ncbi:MAG: pyridoxamine 5'-phosphate oxidase family protein [Sphingomonadaceae bacterium]|nr:pyridoxamine 5'-phosphate oxidase family protein [Sphingomonadaceae bacterium]
MFETLEDIRADIAARLGEAASNRRSAMHVPVVGTTDGDLRMMVLRAFDPGDWTLRFHTDVRSPKVATIGQGGRVSVLLHDPEAKMQLRCRGQGRIETQGGVADAAWAEATNYAKRCYLSEAAPGAHSEAATSGLPAEVEGINPSAEQLLPARANFAVLLVDITSVDWLYLAHDGHRRAQFSVPGGAGRWVVP